MKKLVRTNLTNSPTRRGTENLNIQFYSHDRNNAGFEFVVSNESDLTNYTAKVLFNFIDSASTWEANGTVEGNVVKVSFNTDLIARCEEVLGYLFLDSDSDSLDVFKFKFNVVLSEVDKGEVANRQIKHVNNIGDLELVTRSQLTEELSKLQINSVDLTNYLTTTVAEETYAKKTDLPTPYNDSALSERVTNLENRTDRDTVYNDTEVKERLTTLENKPPVDLSDYALKSELPQPYNDSALVQKIGQLEARVDKDTVYDDTPLKQRVEALETKVDKDTIYNDEEVKQRLTALESRPSSQSEMRGTGMPNGVVEAPIGTTYIDTAKTNGALKWIKTTDGGNTGWKVAEGDTGWVLGWQEDKGNNTNRMYFRRKNDVVHVKFEPKINSSSISPETNLILEITGYDSDDTLSIDGFKPVDDIVQTIYKTSNEIYSTTAGAENSEGSQGTGVVIIQYEYHRVEKSGLKLQIVTSELGVQNNHVNPFSYLTEDEWPVQLP